jgi:hypothetical protein
MNMARHPSLIYRSDAIDATVIPPAAHLANPSSRNIVNPAHLDPVPRDSICEQCHLIGAARVLNPGKQFADFTVGKPLEETFTIYRNVLPPGTTAAFRVISHSE